MYILIGYVRYYYGFEFLGKGTSLLLSLHTDLGLLISWWAFSRYRILSSGNRVSSFLNFVGRRSLDVYFIHYFLLPYNMDFVGAFFNPLNIPFIEYLIAVAIALPMTAVALGIGAVLRLSPLTSQLLLASKQ